MWQLPNCFFLISNFSLFFSGLFSSEKDGFHIPESGSRSFLRKAFYSIPARKSQRFGRQGGKQRWRQADKFKVSVVEIPEQILGNMNTGRPMTMGTSQYLKCLNYLFLHHFSGCFSRGTQNDILCCQDYLVFIKFARVFQFSRGSSYSFHTRTGSGFEVFLRGSKIMNTSKFHRSGNG